MSGLFGSTTIKGNAITDFAKQTSTVGDPIPFGYGRYIATGHVIWTDDVVTHVTEKKQGKGGIKTEEYSYTRSYAISFCAGPIYGYFTIRRDGKIVYTTDPNAKVEDTDFAAKWAQKVAFYFGTRTQMPDSTIEAKEGAGEVSAFRDLAYIVVENDDVTNGGGAIPNYEAVVVASPPEVYMTSRPYPIESSEYLGVTTLPLIGDYRNSLHTYVGGELATVNAVPLSAILKASLDTLTAPSEAATVNAMPLSAVLSLGFTSFTAPNEAATVGAVPLSAFTQRGLINYTAPSESASVNCVPLSGVLST